MAVYLVDELLVDVAVSYASLDENAQVVLLQDAVYSAAKLATVKRTFVIEDDVSRRGLNSKIPPKVSIISYAELVQMMKKDKVINFL